MMMMASPPRSVEERLPIPSFGVQFGGGPSSVLRRRRMTRKTTLMMMVATLLVLQLDVPATLAFQHSFASTRHYRGHDLHHHQQQQFRLLAVTAPTSDATESKTTTTTTATTLAATEADPDESQSQGMNENLSSNKSNGNTSNNNNNDDGNESTSLVEFPPPLSSMDRMKRAAQFWFTAVPVIANYYGLIGSLKLQEILNGKPLDDEQVQALWNQQHEDGANKLASTITDLKGFYVKTAQIISSRRDLFPEQYTDALSIFTDNVDPMPAALAKAVVQSELLHDGEEFDQVFTEFDEQPLGAASVAQVHRAVLSPAYGGPREVAVKIQRPSIESKLLGDVANLKALAKTFRDNPQLPLDYYTVFAELEQQLAEEFDFVAEAVAMDRIYKSLVTAPDGTPRALPLVVPRPVAGLVSRRVLVMDYLRGVPLSRAREEMQARGIAPDSPEAQLFSRQLLTSLTQVFGRNILETGFFHADPHAGNIFVLDDGQVGLIDFGQVKQISGRKRETLCKIMVALDERVGDDRPEDLATIGRLARELGVELIEDAQEEAAAAVGMWLFDGTVEKLPGGYDTGELEPNSPVRELKSFAQDLVLVGRSSILIKGLSNRLGIPWSLASEWAPIARSVLSSEYGDNAAKQANVDEHGTSQRVRFRQVWSTFKQWSKGRAAVVVRRLPSPVRTKLASLMVKVEEQKSRRRLVKRQKTRKP